MKMCCNSLTLLAENAEGAGLSIAFRSENRFRWVGLVARACRVADEDKLSALPHGLGLPQPVRVEEQIGIAYCPFCGANLADFISTNETEFDQQAQKARIG